MSNRTEMTMYLSALLEKKLNPKNDTRIYMAKEVTFDYGTQYEKRVDYVKFDPVNNTVGGIEQGIFSCYEVKSCVEDFRSKYGHNMLGDYNYYVMPKDVYDKVKDNIPWGAGVLCPFGEEGTQELKSVRRATKKTRRRSATEILMMMFRSANRDLIIAKGMKNRY